VIIVDTHTHVHQLWFEPVETLLFHMDRNDVQHAVLVQDTNETDNTYQFDCLQRYPGRFASVVWIDTDRDDAPQELERLAEQGAVGVRWRITTRSPGEDPYLIWRTAKRLNLAISCSWGGGTPWQSKETGDLLSAVPGLQIVIEHFGNALASNGHTVVLTEPNRELYAQLASYPNVYVKFHGLGEYFRRAVPHTRPFPFETPVPRSYAMIYECFGPKRMMWASDYPPNGIREGYRNAIKFPLEFYADKSEEEREWMFGRTALGVFPIRPV
jgi:predicted TIM-barrel fold metal-dependent hydrolase